MRTQENYRKVPKVILQLKNNNRILLLTLFNILVGTYLEREKYFFRSRFLISLPASSTGV